MKNTEIVERTYHIPQYVADLIAHHAHFGSVQQGSTVTEGEVIEKMAEMYSSIEE